MELARARVFNSSRSAVGSCSTTERSASARSITASGRAFARATSESCTTGSSSPDCGRDGSAHDVLQLGTPALAADVDAIQCGHEEFWDVSTSEPATNAMTIAASLKRRQAYEELFDAKASTMAPIVACVKRARAAEALAKSETNANITFALMAMSDGLAWQRITEPQLTPQHLRQHARRSLG